MAIEDRLRQEVGKRQGAAIKFTDIDGIGQATAQKIKSIRGVNGPRDVADMSADELADKAGISRNRAAKAINGGGGNPDVSKRENTGSMSAAGIGQRQGDFWVEFTELDKARARNDPRSRSEMAVKTDNRKRAPVTTEYEKWKQAPSVWDFPAVDTPTQDPKVLPKDLKQGDPDTAEFDEQGQAEYDENGESYPKVDESGQKLRPGPNEQPKFASREAGFSRIDAPGLAPKDLEQDEPEPGPDVMGPKPSAQRLPEPIRQGLASGESADLAFSNAEKERTQERRSQRENSISLTLDEKAKPPLNPVTELPGVGPKTAERLQRKYGITTIRDYYQDEQVAREELSEQYRERARAVAADAVGANIPGL